ncbi:hypothetical protein Tco_1536617 [Tanacetum coccineum]
MTMRTKPDVDTLSIDDLYNNLGAFEQELTSTLKSSASAQNVAFISYNKSSTNKLKSGHTVIYSLFAKQSEYLDLLHEDLEQIDDGEHTVEEEETNHALIAISSNNEANEIYAKDEKLKKYRRIGMKAVKEKEQLQKTVDSWKNSSKNNEVLSYEEEMNCTVFKCTEEDFLNKPLYNRFSKTDNFK